MARTSISDKLLWLDLEMTGLDPKKDRIIEVAAIITDFDFKELDNYHAVIKQPAKVLNGMDEWNQITHAKSGLITKIKDGITEVQAEKAILELMSKHFNQSAILAGNSIHFDRRFIEKYWPSLTTKLHYRMLDVSAWKVVMQAKYNVSFNKQENHRALEDVRESIAELKHYLAYFQKAVQ